MVNFMCWLDWPMRCPDIWSNIILGVWEKVFLDEIDMWIFGLSEGDCPSSVVGPHPISWRPGSNKRANTLTIKIDLFLPDSWAGTSVFCWLQTHPKATALLGAWACCWLLDSDFHWLSQSSGLWTQFRIWGLQLANNRSLGVSASIITWASSL